MESINYDFAKRMAIILKIFNGNISEVARQAGITPPSAKRWITGESDPQMSNLVKLAKAAGVSVEWLATGEGEQCAKAFRHQPNNTEEHETATDIMGNPIDLEDFVFIPQYEKTVAETEPYRHITESEDETNYPVPFRRAWLKRYVPVDFHRLSVFSIKDDSMKGVLNNRDTILVNHTQQSPANGLYVIRMGKDVMVKRTQLLPHNRLRVSSENKSYEPFEIDLNEKDLDFKVVGKVEACFSGSPPM